MSTVTRKEFAQVIVEEFDCSMAQAGQLVDAFFESLAGAICRGNRVEVRGFGAWEVRKTREKMGRNPKTGQKVFVPARRKVLFKPGKVLRSVLKDPRMVEEVQEALG